MPAFRDYSSSSDDSTASFNAQRQRRQVGKKYNRGRARLFEEEESDDEDTNLLQRSSAEEEIFKNGGREKKGGVGKSWARKIQSKQRKSSGRVFNPASSLEAPYHHNENTGKKDAEDQRQNITKNINNNMQPVFDHCLLAAPITIFGKNGNPDYAAISKYASALKQDGVDGVFCCGTSGESMSLSVRERKKITEAWISTGMKVCAHIGAHALPDSMTLAAHAQTSGADAIAVICPPFFKPVSIHEIVDFLSEISRAAPKIPMLIYHFPQLTGTTFRLFDIFNLALKRGTVPNLRGAKFTGVDLADYAACLSIGGPITDVLYSIEQNMVGAAFIGATSFVGMQFSIIAPLYIKLLAAAQRGANKEAGQLQRFVAQFVGMMQSAVGPSLEKMVAAAKVLVGLRLEMEVGETRPPGAKVSAEEKRKLKEGMAEFVESYKRKVCG